MKEIQLESILNAAKRMEEITVDTLSNKVLEIDSSAASAEKNRFLGRLVASLDHYSNKGRALKYIGFVGHYSSGKSSTINSILGLRGTNNERDTGLNPTDKAITLITHPKNSNFLLLMNREGGSVPIRTIFVENDLLSDLVISDTPGAGDPNVVNEIVQDFLPICDRIFYFITSTNPLAESDLPLLKQKSNKLPFIPILYIVTRADEFRVDKSQRLTDINLNQSKKDEFLGRLISRIKSNIEIDNLFQNDFVFVDNEAEFNIDKVIEQLSTTSTVDDQSLLEMHGHKVEYFRIYLHQIISFFEELINSKIAKSEGFVKTANENIIRFDKSVEINNEKLKSLWVKSETSIKEALVNESKSLDEIRTNISTEVLSYDKGIVAEKRAIGQNVESLSSGYLGKLVQDINMNTKQRLREIKLNILTNIETTKEIREDITNLLPTRIDLEHPQQSIEIDFSKFNDQLHSLSQKLSSTLNDVKGSIRYKLNQVKGFSSRELLVNSVLQAYNLGQSSINDNFDSYFEKIQMYRSTVLTKNTKETIESLRIGTKLDQLDSEFPEDYVSSMKAKAIDAVYLKNESYIEDLKNRTANYLSEISSVRDVLERISIPKHGDISPLTKETIDGTLLVSELITQREEFINKIYQVKLTTVLDKHGIIFKDYKESLVTIRVQRKKALIKWALVCIGLSVLTGGLVFFRYVPSPGTIIGDVLVGIVPSIIVYIFGLIYTFLKKDISKLTAQRKTEFLSKSKSEIIRSLDETFWDDLSKKMTEEKLSINSTIIKSKISEKIDPIILELVSANQVVLGELSAVFKNFKLIVAGYESRLSEFHGRFSNVFSQHEENLQKIGKITDQIKEFSIKPSFDLLKKVTAELKDVQKKIKSTYS